ncbi:hypothetical protein ACX0HA_14865 [Flavobacterium hauense]
MNNNTHTFHIPVMGLAYTIDSPIRVAHYGISSVISIMDDDLIERMNAFYSEKFSIPYQEITKKINDYRARRITAYLDLVDQIVTEKFNAFKDELTQSCTVLENFITMLPGKSELKRKLETFVNGTGIKDSLRNYLDEHLSPGSIDVNIMTKVDRQNSENNTLLPDQFNDAHAALRGFANSRLNSSVILSAGLNPKLYAYFEDFTDFYPDKDFRLKKKVIIKVSDYRSALIQGSYFAKKGIWVSEFRIESGLNCGGHAFASDGTLLGPVLEEFKQKKGELIKATYELLCKGLLQKGYPVPPFPPALQITVQGGVGTHIEHEFLLEYYQTDSVGWGSPFLLVPEATAVDNDTRELLAKAKEEDLYTSNMSPLGVPFNAVRGMTNENLRLKRIKIGRPGSSCPKKYLALDKEYDLQGMCTASAKYQKKKVSNIMGNQCTTDIDLEQEYEKITEKSCLCVGLSNAALLENDILIKGDRGVIVCPGPNIAYFDREYSLQEMVQHIYGGTSIIDEINRPNLFLKELQLNVDILKTKSFETEVNDKQLAKTKNNLLEGVLYYKKLFLERTDFKASSFDILILNNAEDQLNSLCL